MRTGQRYLEKRQKKKNHDVEETKCVKDGACQPGAATSNDRMNYMAHILWI